MTNAMKDGGPAFPVPLNPDDTWKREWDNVNGMSLRDWFAGQALAGMLARADTVSIADGIGSRESGVAFAIADSMLKAREGERS